MHGKSSSLLRKHSRSQTLKHPRSDDLRATKSGVVHKFCSSENLENAVQIHRNKVLLSERKVSTLSHANQRLLHDSWHRVPSARLFTETLLSLLEEGKLSEFDLSFLHNWLEKKSKGRYCRADEQARSLTVLYSNKLGERAYSEMAPMLGLPVARQARKIRSKETANQHFLPGLNNWAIEAAAGRESRPIQCGMDGTRIIRSVELYLDKYLVGKAFSPDIRMHPDESHLPTTESSKQVQDYVLGVRLTGSCSAEAYSFNLSDTSGKLPNMLIGSIPEAKVGITGAHVFALMMEVEKRATIYKLPLVGHCTDSASNTLLALTKLASPATYIHVQADIAFIGLECTDFIFFVPILRPGLGSVAYPCWDHSGRTVLRNLMNQNVTIVAGKHSSSGDGIQ